jgi:4-amino-4-deoxy-L-arabinose transferase-like glycosyltransferase
MKTRNISLVVIIILFFINLVLSIYATPVSDDGDAASYIELSKKFLGENVNQNMAHRSPLYSLMLAPVIKVFGIPTAFKLMIYIQYCLVFVTSILIYFLFKRIFDKPLLPSVISVLFNLSISTIYFANILLTEILTIFLLFVSIHFFLQYFNNNRFKYLISTGFSLGLLSLARFNTVPIIFPFLFLLSYLLVIKSRTSFKKGIITIIVFLIPYIFVLNSWALYNLDHNGFYGLFPGTEFLVSRNVIVASITEGNKVSPEEEPVLDIFIKAKHNYNDQQITKVKGSLSSIDRFGILNDLYSGYQIYGIAYVQLNQYFGLKETDGEFEINIKLRHFYKEIVSQNKAFIWKLRIYSLLSSFRASTSGILGSNYGIINLNILPSFLIKLNKIIVPIISFFVFISFFIFAFKSIKYQNAKPDFVIMTMFILIFSFWGINFLFAAAGDANRFKFPVEPLILGIFIYYINNSINWIKINLWAKS